MALMTDQQSQNHLRAQLNYLAIMQAARWPQTPTPNPGEPTMSLSDHAALHEPKDDPRAGERELLKFECMRLAATRPDIRCTEELVAAGQAIFEAVTGGDVEITVTPPQINLVGAS